MTDEPLNLGLTDTQWEKLAYGTAFSLLQQAVDNGDHAVVDFDEFLPTGFDITEEETDFYAELGKRVDKIADVLHDEANKRDA